MRNRSLLCLLFLTPGSRGLANKFIFILAIFFIKKNPFCCVPHSHTIKNNISLSPCSLGIALTESTLKCDGENFSPPEIKFYSP
jgi:hypothetical protein